MRARRGVLVLLSLACGERTLSPGATPDGGADAPGVPDVAPMETSQIASRSGSRLKARWSVAPDGRRLFLGSWVDGQLGTSCTFTLTADGVYRCIPRQIVTSVGHRIFTNPGCSEPAVLLGRTVPADNLGNAACAPATFILRYDFSVCGSGIRIFRLGREVTGPNFFTGLGGRCDLSFLVPGESAFAVGEEVPLTSFVAARRQVVPASGAVQPVVLEADDGARQFLGWQNAADHAACDLLALQDGRAHCVSSAGTTSGLAFADPACTERAFLRSSCFPERNQYAEVPLPGQCPAQYRVHTVGEPLTTYWSTFDGGCMPHMATASSGWMAIGAEVAPQTFPALDIVDEPAGRLRRRSQVVPGTTLTTTWVDADRGDTCRPYRSGDVARCFPGLDQGRSALYADGACTVPLMAFERGKCPTRHVFDIDESACPVRPRVFAVGPAHVGPVFVRDLDRSANPPRVTCEPYVPRSTGEPYTLTPVPETDLAELTIVVD